jgi:hypothetical protein
VLLFSSSLPQQKDVCLELPPAADTIRESAARAADMCPSSSFFLQVPISPWLLFFPVLELKHTIFGL